VGKVWVLDTETKGTGAEMVPLEKVQKQPAAPERRRRKAPAPARAKAAPKPQRPDTFKVVDVMTRLPLIEDASARETIERLRGVRSIVDVTIHAWDDRAERWQRLSRGEERALWRLRDELPAALAD
jgi:hypothetical protein